MCNSHDTRSPFLLISATFILVVLSQTSVAQSIRNVTPKGMTQVYREENQRNFREPGERLSPIRMQNDGTLGSPAGSIRLYGVKLPELREICRTTTSARWTCGARAAGALRGLVHMQTIECAPPKSPGEAPTRVCWIGSTNLSVWLLEQGWADLASIEIEKEYRDAVASAKSKRIGLWSNGGAP